MSEHEFDELISLALSDLETDVPESFRQAIAGARAPLASVIDNLLRRQPGIRFYNLLRAIATLNQGRLEDLNVPIFQSYIIRKTGISEVDLLKCIAEINSFWQLTEMEKDPASGLLMAARDEDNSGGGRVSIGDLLSQLQKRTQ